MSDRPRYDWRTGDKPVPRVPWRVEDGCSDPVFYELVAKWVVPGLRAVGLTETEFPDDQPPTAEDLLQVVCQAGVQYLVVADNPDFTAGTDDHPFTLHVATTEPREDTVYIGHCDVGDLRSRLRNVLLWDGPPLPTHVVRLSLSVLTRDGGTVAKELTVEIGPWMRLYDVARHGLDHFDRVAVFDYLFKAEHESARPPELRPVRAWWVRVVDTHSDPFGDTDTDDTDATLSEYWWDEICSRRPECVLVRLAGGKYELSTDSMDDMYLDAVEVV
jgi:hypothetical protein